MSRRRSAATIGLCALILGAATVGYQLLFDDTLPPALPVAVEPPTDALPPPRPEPPEAATSSFALVRLEGAVEIREGASWRPAHKGDRLHAGDAIRSGPDGRAVLASDEGDELALRERVELEVSTLSATVAELTLSRGKVNAAAGASRNSLRIASAGAEAISEGGGRFTVYADPHGTVAVASAEGQVRVIARGGQVLLQPGMQSVVPPGGRPGEAVPVPEEVFLAVTWPGEVVPSPRVSVRGRTTPGSTVSVNGVAATVDPTGRFEARLALRAGKNEVVVSAESIDGRTREVSYEVVVDTAGPPLEADPSRLFEPPPPASGSRDGGAAGP